MRTGSMLLVTLVSGGVVAAAQAPDLKRMDVVERSVPAGPVAIVDKTPVEGADFLREYRRHLKNFMQMMDNPELTDEFRVRAGLTILGEMIQHEILLREAERRGISIPDGDVEKEYQDKLRRFEEMLAEELGQKPTEAQILERAGQNREEAKQSIREQLMAERISEIIAKETDVTVTTEEARDYYDKNPNLFQQPGKMHLWQILIVPKPNPTKADESAWKRAEESAEKARSRILAGEQFATVARDVSEAPDAAKGGDLGMLPVVELPPFFVNIASGMNPGDISGVFRSEFGVHLIRLVATEDADKVSFEQAEPSIRRMLRRIKTEDAVLHFCEPVVNDPERTKIFIQLERTLAALTGK